MTNDSFVALIRAAEVVATIDSRNVGKDLQDAQKVACEFLTKLWQVHSPGTSPITAEEFDRIRAETKAKYIR